MLTYAEREVFHSRSGTNGVVQEDIEGVVAAAFTHWDSRAGDPQLHDHVVVANRARSVSDGTWRTLDSRGLFKSVVALSELHQGVLSDLLTKELGWGWDGRARRHSEQLRFEVTGVPEALMAEFSQRSAAIEERKTVLIGEFVAALWPPADQCGGPRPAAPGDPGDPAGQGAPQPGGDDRGLAPAGRGLRRRRPAFLGGRTGGSQRSAAPARRRPGRGDPGRRRRRGGADAWPSAGPPSPGPTSWPRCTASCTGSVSPRPTSGSPSPSAPRTWPWPSRCSSRRPSCTTRRSGSAGPTGRAGSGPRATRSTPRRRSWKPRPACSRPGARWTVRPPPWALWRR